MSAHFLSWTGSQDLTGGGASIENTLNDSSLAITNATILWNQGVFEVARKEKFKYANDSDYEDSLRNKFKEIEFNFIKCDITDPTDFGRIWAVSNPIFSQIVEADSEAETIVNLTSGTPTMCAIWSMLAASNHARNISLVQSSKEGPVRKLEKSLLFDIWAGLLPSALDSNSRSLIRPKISSQSLKDLVSKRSRAYSTFADLDSWITNTTEPVLIYGESGTGKENIASAIADHWTAMSRGNVNSKNVNTKKTKKNFVAVNCAGLGHLIDVELFGSEKGAFTGAEQKKGLMEEVDGGVLFLDELGELPMQSQAKVLRALQEKKIRRVGGDKEFDVD
ncbi:sigma-54 factor interaction domain-containing protein, partial [Litorivicinus sp.]|nr:sigma-54 factor interaction domain-containing protein [Litorivicinus sp.]